MSIDKEEYEEMMKHLKEQGNIPVTWDCGYDSTVINFHGFSSTYNQDSLYMEMIERYDLPNASEYGVTGEGVIKLVDDTPVFSMTSYTEDTEYRTQNVDLSKYEVLFRGKNKTIIYTTWGNRIETEGEVLDIYKTMIEKALQALSVNPEEELREESEEVTIKIINGKIETTIDYTVTIYTEEEHEDEIYSY